MPLTMPEERWIVCVHVSWGRGARLSCAKQGKRDLGEKSNSLAPEAAPPGLSSSLEDLRPKEVFVAKAQHHETDSNSHIP